MTNKDEKGSEHEGRDRYFMDIDRMINEGMAGGTVSRPDTQAQIDESRPLYEEEPPVEYKNKKNDK
ncbi:hypothetical protein [Bacillus sp. Marseille-Q3570]|uniref:hypothetical protein n=1 Tax=Bacillus sp. Marseille-Q3570 TaxID=2963522 RepID=UPI0021B7877C|nr:hypothetical protein [Bacillus sp. Marseille-Q3570]